MTSLAWSLASLPVRLMVAGVRGSQALPKPPSERPTGRARFDPSGVGLAALERSARAGSRRLEDPEGRWLELVNKVRAFADFRSAAEPAAEGTVDEADEAQVFADLWRREGRGFLSGRQAAGGGVVEQDLSSRDVLPHHTGFGLGLASHHLDALPARPRTASVELAVDAFLEDCRRLSRRGYEGAVVEALGLAVQLLRPALVRRVDARLAARSARCRQLFWHGLGRGLYFEPRDMAPRPGERWRAAERALEMAPDEVTQRNAVAGVAWAAALVNFLDPAIIAARLRSPALDRAGDAAANGIASVALLWLHAVGDGPPLHRLRDLRPGPDAGTGELWRRRVAEPIGLAVDRVYPLLADQERIDELFRYRGVDGWERALALEAPAGAERGEEEVPVHG